MMTVYLRKLAIEGLEHILNTGQTGWSSRPETEGDLRDAINELKREQEAAYNG